MYVYKYFLFNAFHFREKYLGFPWQYIFYAFLNLTIEENEMKIRYIYSKEVF